mmetsp:Transcript_24155/g.37265  ORF Transcript_24155/g.37265 Transcript_24155/m.37265 type:complete len:619 (+) Transcript_24155:144-2000(+)|eukprot:CAMPEP_0118682920 /NCGR_PEP_ID=MMETSP0800-20121206/5750_1 /TAXON_ID=210618 ORGANISM="Striatella unipunctata, Strain CCMP2910" /NCGR_SAMPLE_ID=MMETSP0800 /ASSEMBLY_ACC=CAM_ASM_000638 /LENGTH=618 /DNA_ID=CAMNT_0006579357 /DNA_START=107 /DNA_END=1963 /DNA_ORIENTATION=-
MAPRLGHNLCGMYLLAVCLIAFLPEKNQAFFFAREGSISSFSSSSSQCNQGLAHKRVSPFRLFVKKLPRKEPSKEILSANLTATQYEFYTTNYHFGHPKKRHAIYDRPPPILNRSSPEYWDWEGPPSLKPSERWDTHFEALLDFRSVHGHCLVRIEDGALGDWVSAQRRDFRRIISEPGYSPRILTPERLELLRSVGFVFDPVEFRWQQKYKDLLVFKEKFNHTDVPRSYGPLGTWVQIQRAEYKLLIKAESGTGKKSKLTPKRLELLEAVGFIWDSKEHQFQKDLQRLKDFIAEHGHMNVRARHGTLGEWFYTKRKEYKKKINGEPSPMSDHHKKELEKVGFCPEMFLVRKFYGNVPFDHEGNLEKMRRYAKQHGHANIPRDSKLGEWAAYVRSQKKRYDDGREIKIPPYVFSEIARIGFVWDVQQWMWEQRLDELAGFEKAHGHMEVPLRYGPLGEWVKQNRFVYELIIERNETANMTAKFVEKWVDRFHHLHGIGFNFERWEQFLDDFDSDFNGYASRLSVLHRRQGNFCVEDIDDSHFTEWVEVQRRQCRLYLRGEKTKLQFDDRKLRRLIEIGFLEDVRKSMEEAEQERQDKERLKVKKKINADVTVPRRERQ